MHCGIHIRSVQEACPAAPTVPYPTALDINHQPERAGTSRGFIKPHRLIASSRGYVSIRFWTSSVPVVTYYSNTVLQ